MIADHHLALIDRSLASTSRSLGPEDWLFLADSSHWHSKPEWPLTIHSCRSARNIYFASRTAASIFLPLRVNGRFRFSSMTAQGRERPVSVFFRSTARPACLCAAPHYSQINHEIQIDDTSLTGDYYRMRTPGYFEMQDVGNFGTRKYGCFEMRNSGNFDANTQKS
ncbi:hypothetical protein ACFQAT_26030 [Undibacterium arcticum]|uniref:hypothetical protein n=1 Tax=Undibacterium arcticum TaxID=1762892 RepID=UPI00360FA8D5